MSWRDVRFGLVNELLEPQIVYHIADHTLTPDEWTAMSPMRSLTAITSSSLPCGCSRFAIVGNPKIGYDPMDYLTNVAYLAGSPIAFVVSTANNVISLQDILRGRQQRPPDRRIFQPRDLPK